MKTNALIIALHKLSQQGTQYRRTVCRLAADALEAALADIKKADTECDFCEHNGKDAPCEAADCDCSICTEDCVCKTCWDNSNWQWRGNKEANPMVVENAQTGETVPTKLLSKVDGHGSE